MSVAKIIDLSEMDLEENPYQLYNQVLGNVATSNNPAINPQDKTVLFDPALERIKALRSQLVGAERAKLDNHLDAIEQVANNMRSNLPLASECTPTAAQPTPAMNIKSADYRRGCHPRPCQCISHRFELRLIPCRHPANWPLS